LDLDDHVAGREQRAAVAAAAIIEWQVGQKNHYY